MFSRTFENSKRRKMTLNLLVSNNVRRLMISNLAAASRSQQQLGSLVLSSDVSLGSFASRLLNTTNARFLNVNHRKAYFAVRSQLIKALNSQKKNAVVRIDQKSLTLKPNASQSSKPTESAAAKTPPSSTTEQASIFKRFKEAYKQHGMVLIATHMVTSVGWITGFYMLSKGYINIL